MTIEKVAKFALYAEGYSMLLIGPLLFIYPELMINIFFPDLDVSSLAKHHSRFFAVAIFAFFGVHLLKSLNSSTETLKSYLKTLVIVDVGYLSAFYLFAMETGNGRLNLASFGNLLLGVLILLLRVYILISNKISKDKRN